MLNNFIQFESLENDFVYCSINQQKGLQRLQDYQFVSLKKTPTTK